MTTQLGTAAPPTTAPASTNVQAPPSAVLEQPYDTVDHRLRAAGITLVRVDGPDPHWDLHLAGGPPVREQVRRAAPRRRDGGSEVPARFREILFAHLRTAALVEVPTPAPAPRDAEGTGRQPATATGKKGRTRTADRPRPLRAKDPVRELVAASLRAGRDDVLVWDPQVRLGTDDAVHKLRVALRRLRALLRTFRPVLLRDRADTLEAELRWAGTALGEVRDMQVLRERLLAEIDTLPAEAVLGRARIELSERLTSRLLQAQEAALAALSTPRYLDLLHGLDAWADHPPVTPAADQPIGKVAGQLARKAHRTLERRVTMARDDAGWHTARKAAKRARYTAEAISPVIAAASHSARRYEAIQEALGEYQDSVVARELLLDLGRRAPDTSGFALGAVYGIEQSRAVSSRAAFDLAWQSALQTSAHRWMRRT